MLIDTSQINLVLGEIFYLSQVGSLELGLPQGGSLKLSPRQDGFLELGSRQGGSLKLSPRQDGFLELGSRQVGSLKLGPL